MKTNTLHSVTNLCESLVIAITIVLVSAVTTAKAQSNVSNISISDIPDSTRNGLFTPTAAQRFFEKGRKSFEREEDILVDSDFYFNEDLLQIDPEVRERIKETMPASDFEQDNSL